MQLVLYYSFGLLSLASAWMTVPSAPTTIVRQTKPPTALSCASRKDFLQSSTTAALTTLMVVLPSPDAAMATTTTTTLPNGVVYQVLKQGTGPRPEKGELVAIRFLAYAGDIKIDDITNSPEPYYTRVGSGGLLKGVEETLPLMRLGDCWKLTIPPNLAFGGKSRPASPGKPRIPGDTVVTFQVEMVGLPGKEPELIELIGDV